MMIYTNKVLVWLFLLHLIAAVASASEAEVCLNNEECADTDNNKPTPFANLSPDSAARMERVKKNMLWKAVIQQQGDIPFGKVLDAGTGLNSLYFIGSLTEHGLTSYTAITGSKSMYNDVNKHAKELGIANMGEIIHGNWFAKKAVTLTETQYDTIIVDYLIGAMDAFSPYQQDVILKKLVPYLKPGGRMYFIGLEPIPDRVADDDKKTNSVEGANIICQMRRVRDACALLAGNRPYREYPVEWVQRQFEKLDGMKVLSTKTYTNLWDTNMFGKQIQNGRAVLNKFPTPELAENMELVLANLVSKFLKALKKVEGGGKIKFGFDYVIVAEKQKE